MQIIKEGSIVVGKVTSIKRYGFFVEINESITGLVHISEISNKFVPKINAFVDIGELILVQIKEIQDDKLILSIKDIKYKAKNSCINLVKPTLKLDNDSFDIFENKFQDWFQEWDNSKSM